MRWCFGRPAGSAFGIGNGRRLAYGASDDGRGATAVKLEQDPDGLGKQFYPGIFRDSPRNKRCWGGHAGTTPAPCSPVILAWVQEAAGPTEGGTSDRYPTTGPADDVLDVSDKRSSYRKRSDGWRDVSPLVSQAAIDRNEAPGNSSGPSPMGGGSPPAVLYAGTNPAVYKFREFAPPNWGRAASQQFPKPARAHRQTGRPR